MTVETEGTQAPSPLPPNSAPNNGPAIDASAGQGLNSSLYPCREKYWEECTVEEKLERVRDTLMSINRDQVQVGESLHRLLRHSHAPNGDPVSPVVAPGHSDFDAYSRDRTHSIKTEFERNRR